jgi:hypothetical protein
LVGCEADAAFFGASAVGVAKFVPTSICALAVVE